MQIRLHRPLPGSEDHKKLFERNVRIDPDLNAYDLETVTVDHPRVSREEWQRAYMDAWNWYYTEMFDLNASSRAAVEKARRQARSRTHAESVASANLSRQLAAATIPWPLTISHGCGAN